MESLYVVSYDITCDKKRRKVSDTLEDYGPRIQKSVFECALAPAALQELMEKLEGLVDPATDSVLFYLICKSCRERVRALGIYPVRREKGFAIL
jgi:CRISPR-associated protein Cas2